jgi:hypothetical protein
VNKTEKYFAAKRAFAHVACARRFGRRATHRKQTQQIHLRELDFAE